MVSDTTVVVKTSHSRTRAEKSSIRAISRSRVPPECRHLAWHTMDSCIIPVKAVSPAYSLDRPSAVFKDKEHIRGGAEFKGVEITYARRM